MAPLILQSDLGPTFASITSSTSQPESTTAPSLPTSDLPTKSDPYLLKVPDDNPNKHEDDSACAFPVDTWSETCWALKTAGLKQFVLAADQQKSMISITPHVRQEDGADSSSPLDWPGPPLGYINQGGGADAGRLEEHWWQRDWAEALMAACVVFSLVSLFVLGGLKLGGWLDWKGNLNFCRNSARRNRAYLRRSTSYWVWPEAADEHHRTRTGSSDTATTRSNSHSNSNEYELRDMAGLAPQDIFYGRYNRVDLSGLNSDERRRAVAMLESDEEILRRWSRAGLIQQDQARTGLGRLAGDILTFPSAVLSFAGVDMEGLFELSKRLAGGALGLLGLLLVEDTFDCPIVAVRGVCEMDAAGAGFFDGKALATPCEGGGLDGGVEEGSDAVFGFDAGNDRVAGTFVAALAGGNAFGAVAAAAVGFTATFFCPPPPTGPSAAMAPMTPLPYPLM
ncbi:unnamed protein product [Zymoseptoria tritici ST99CH_1A5]|uniref:Uncharacterized protein n=1 Tax=Zymoseptoria tritici ST99CH_1A5 TaxID=1276529 RepID=A0A1Y6LLC4_ZYMTR|nr:unnamed protein product [Zymoseptoria tritici ST99CH_1A5]